MKLLQSKRDYKKEILNGKSSTDRKLQMEHSGVKGMENEGQKKENFER